MTWPFENDTGAIVKRLAKRSLASESRRNLMVVTAVALAAFLICFAAVVAVSIAQILTVVPYQFPFLQMGLYLFVMFGMEAILSVWMVRRQKKQSLVEQMRAME